LDSLWVRGITAYLCPLFALILITLYKSPEKEVEIIIIAILIILMWGENVSVQSGGEVERGVEDKMAETVKM
jgi:hypothetical protein